MPRILFIHNCLTEFVRLDLEELRKHYDVTELHEKSRYINPVARWKQVREHDLIFGWFASWHTFLPLMMAAISHKPSVLVVGGYDVANMPEIGYGHQRGGLKKWVSRRTMNFADLLVTPSSYSRDETIHNASIDGKRTHAIYLGVPDHFESLPNGSRARMALTVGNVERSNLQRKGHEPFVRAAALLPDVNFVVVGNWKDDAIEYLRSIATPNVTFTGRVSDDALRDYYRKAAVYVQASLHEGFGLSVAEAMLAGCVPVTTRAGSLSEVTGECGLRLSSPDAAEIAQVVQAALAYPDEARSAIRARILEKFPMNKRRQQLQQLIEPFMAVVIPSEAPAPKVHCNGVKARKLPRPFQKLNPKWGLVTLDVLVLLAAFGLSYLLRYDFAIPRKEWNPGLVQVLIAVPLQLSALYATGVRKFIWRYIGLNELGAFARAALWSAFPLLLLRVTLPQSLSAGRVPISVIIMDSILALGGTVTLRISRRLLYERYEKLQINTQAISGHKRPVLLIGTGRAGVLAAKEIRCRSDMDFSVEGFVDDAPEKQGMVIQGIKVRGTTNDLARLVRELSIDQVILTIVEAPDHEIQRIVGLCKEFGIKVRIIPGLFEILDGRAEARRVRDTRMKDRTEFEPVGAAKAASAGY